MDMKFWNLLGQNNKQMSLKHGDGWAPLWMDLSHPKALVQCKFEAEILKSHAAEVYNIYRIKMMYDNDAILKHIPYCAKTGYFDVTRFMIDKDSSGGTFTVHGYPTDKTEFDDFPCYIEGQFKYDDVVPEDTKAFFVPKVFYDIIPLRPTPFVDPKHIELIGNVFNYINGDLNYKEIELRITIK